MSRLEPGASYVYERVDGITYARKLGDPPDQRFEVGRDYDTENLLAELHEARLWGDIHRAAKTNPALQDALNRVKLIYTLSKQDETIPHHPV
jgi:hypothetical protein